MIKYTEWSAPMHYINTPVDAEAFDPVLHCPDTCVYKAIVNYTGATFILSRDSIAIDLPSF